MIFDVRTLVFSAGVVCFLNTLMLAVKWALYRKQVAGIGYAVLAFASLSVAILLVSLTDYVPDATDRVLSQALYLAGFVFLLFSFAGKNIGAWSRLNWALVLVIPLLTLYYSQAEKGDFQVRVSLLLAGLLILGGQILWVSRGEPAVSKAGRRTRYLNMLVLVLILAFLSLGLVLLWLVGGPSGRILDPELPQKTLAFSQLLLTLGLSVGLSARVNTRLRENQQEQRIQFQELVELSPDAIAIHLREQIVYLNPAGRRIFGIGADFPLAKNMRLLDFIPKGNREAMARRVEQVFAGKIIMDLEEDLLRADGKVFPASVSGVGVRYQGQDAVQVIIRDLTKTRRAERRAREEQAALLIQQSKLASTGEMLESITHQWKQPLNSISMLAQMLPEEPISGSGRGDTGLPVREHLLDQVDFMTSTINDFRDFLKDDQMARVFDPGQAITQVTGLVEADFRRHKIKLETDTMEGLTAHGKPNEFKHVILNLLTNSRDVLLERKISPAEIQISWERDSQWTRLTISDNGGGIASPLLPDKLFESRVSTKGEKGSGIGLYLAKTIIEDNMGGRIEAYNSGRGACFVVALPRADV